MLHLKTPRHLGYTLLFYSFRVHSGLWVCSRARSNPRVCSRTHSSTWIRSRAYSSLRVWSCARSSSLGASFCCITSWGGASAPALPEVAASAAQPPESAMSISAPLVQVVPTFYISVCPATTTKVAHELPACTVMVKETLCELSDCSVTAREAVYELWIVCPVMAAETIINLSVLFIPVLPDPPWWFPVPSAPLKWSSAPPWCSSVPPSLLWWSSVVPARGHQFKERVSWVWGIQSDFLSPFPHSGDIKILEVG